MRKIWVFLFCFLLFFLTQASFQQPSDIDVRVEVEAVNLLVSVTDRQGRFVTDLPESRFQVFEDGELQTITNFRQESDLPLKIALLMDTSSSVRLKLDFQQRSAKNFLYSVMRLGDRALLVDFDRGVTLVHDFTDRPGTLASEIDQLKAGGGTAIFDALYTVSREKMLAEEGRKVIVVISDGDDLHSQRTHDEAIRMVMSSDVLVYAIGTTRFGADQSSRAERTLTELAEQTGGRAFFPYSSEIMDDDFDRIHQELRSQYSLTYEPQNLNRDGKFRKTEVKLLDDRGLRVRHRKGYYAPGS